MKKSLLIGFIAMLLAFAYGCSDNYLGVFTDDNTQSALLIDNGTGTLPDEPEDNASLQEQTEQDNSTY